MSAHFIPWGSLNLLLAFALETPGVAESCLFSLLLMHLSLRGLALGPEAPRGGCMGGCFGGLAFGKGAAGVACRSDGSVDT